MINNMPETRLREKPILFSAPMVQAILDGRKTQTRRIIKLPSWAMGWDTFETDGKTAQVDTNNGCVSNVDCPHGKVGDNLWVRETWGQTNSDFIYKADYSEDSVPMGLIGNWKPSIHMPRNACRLKVQITKIRVERLHDISEKDAIAEGVELLKYQDGVNKYTICVGLAHFNAPTAKEVFAMLWYAINSVESWDSNPWVWVLEFERVSP